MSELLEEPIVNKPLTWNDLANEYDKAYPNRQSRTLSTQTIWDWAVKQTDKFQIDPKDGTIHRVI